MDLIVENVRSLSGRHVIPIAPLTLVTGENSSGKSTFLAMLSAVLSEGFPYTPNLFNRAPFELGNFSTIASYSGTGGKRANHFTIGRSDEGSLEVEFVEIDGQARIGSVLLKRDGQSVRVKVDGGQIIFNVETPARRETFLIAFKTETMPPPLFVLIGELGGIKSKKNKDLVEVIQKLFSDLVWGVRKPGRTSIALSPVRTKPRRTYDQLAEDFQPEGEHIPFTLARVLGEDNQRGANLRDALAKFGLASGLFEKISLKKLGNKKNLSDPFQIVLKVGAPGVNLMDVGYGVSQALPVLVESVLQDASHTLLLQQPEVHLHPKAQAALGTFFSGLVTHQKKNIVVETHSDYLIDRVRIEIREKRLKLADVALLFFERRRGQTSIHKIDFDELGNVLNPPLGFRDFFLDEQMRVMGIGSQSVRTEVARVRHS